MNEEKRKRIFEIMQVNRKNDRANNIFNVFILAVVLINVSVLFLETFEQLAWFMPALKVLEAITILIFTVEYLLRIWTADYLYPEKSRGKAILRFMTSFSGIVDFCTIFPVIFFPGFIAFRMLRVIRVLHLFRINSRYDSIIVITRVLKEKKGQLLSSLFIILVLMMASSLCMYSVEHEIQPDVFRNAFSGVWWSICTILTVGYGDIYPVTFVGQFLAIVISFLGVGVVAIPTGIISAGFVELMQEHEDTENAQETASVLVGRTSPFCGKTVQEAEEKYPFRIVALVREGAVVLPTSSMEIAEGDSLVCQGGKRR